MDYSGEGRHRSRTLRKDLILMRLNLVAQVVHQDAPYLCPATFRRFAPHFQQDFSSRTPKFSLAVSDLFRYDRRCPGATRKCDE